MAFYGSIGANFYYEGAHKNEKVSVTGYGVYLCFDDCGRLRGRWLAQRLWQKLGRIPSVILTFLTVCIIWVFFRVERLDFAWMFIQRMFAFDFAPIYFSANSQLYVTMIVAAFFSFFTLSKFGLKMQEKVYFSEFSNKKHIVAWCLAAFAFVFCIAALNATDFSPFIYFRF